MEIFGGIEDYIYRTGVRKGWREFQGNEGKLLM